MGAETSPRVRVEIDLLDAGDWYATVYKDGEAVAGSGRFGTAVGALDQVLVNVERYYEEAISA